MGGKSIDNEEFLLRLQKEKPYIIALEEYAGVDNKIKCKCSKCNDIFYTTPWILLQKSNGNGCRKCNRTKKKTHEEYVKELNDSKISITVIEKYKGVNKNILHKCNICGYEWNVKPANILSGCSCPVCKNKKVLIGYNDIWTTNKNIATLLLNSQDGYKYTHGSGKRLDWKCPYCGNIINSKPIRDIVKLGKLPCSKCSDGVSYPMKFMCNVLIQLNINFETEVKFDWCKYKLCDKEKFGIYDIVFSTNNKKYIIEVDGCFHFKNNSMNNQSLVESKIIDSEKNRLAIENNYNVIRILALESNTEYMKSSIISSELNNIFDFSMIDWDTCNVNSLKSNVIKAANLWNTYKNVTKVSTLMNIRRETIIKYLHKATKANLCKYDGKTEQIKSGKRNGKLLRKTKIA